MPVKSNLRNSEDYSKDTNLLCLLDHPVILTPCQHLLLQAAVDQVQPLFQPAPGVYLEAVVNTTSTSPGFLEAFRFNLLLKSSSTRFQLLQGLQRGPLLSHLSLKRPSLKVFSDFVYPRLY